MRDYLERHGVRVKGERRGASEAFLYLECCPVNADCQSGNDTDIAVIVMDSGAIAYKNWHDRGKGLGWVDVREALEPGYKAFAAGQQAPAADVSLPWAPPLPLHARACRFPLADAFPPGAELARDFAQGLSVAYQVPVDLPAMVIPLRACTTKSRRADSIALHPQVADALRAAKPADAEPSWQVFSAIPSMRALKADLKFAGIPFETGAGRADLHAMRKSLATHLAVNSIPQRFAQSHLRHTDPRLTAVTYTDEALLPVAAAIGALPSLPTTARTSAPATTSTASLA